jgi:hypothetical protein
VRPGGVSSIASFLLTPSEPDWRLRSQPQRADGEPMELPACGPVALSPEGQTVHSFTHVDHQCRRPPL